jgi:hypothetical protein
MVSGFKINLATEALNTFDQHTYLPPSNVAIPAAIGMYLFSLANQQMPI